MSKMNSELRNLLRQVADDHGQMTHEATFRPGGEWAMKDSHLTEFWKEYCQLVYQLEETELDSDFCLAEKIVGDTHPIVQDFLLKYPESNNDEPYNDLFLAWLVFVFQTAVAETFQVSDNETLVTLVFESNGSWNVIENDESYNCAMIRLHMPNAHINKEYFKTKFRTKLITLLRKYELFSKMQKHPIGDWDTIMLPQKDSILMFGSVNDPEQQKLNHIFTFDKIEKQFLDANEVPQELSLKEVFDCQLHDDVKRYCIKPTVFENYSVEYWLPFYLSIHYNTSKQLLLKPEAAKKPKVFDFDMKRFGTHSHSRSKFEGNKEENLDLACKLLGFIGKNRYLHESLWLDIGKSLHHVCNGSPEGLKIWVNQTLLHLKDDPSLPLFMLPLLPTEEAKNNISKKSKPKEKINPTNYEEIITAACNNHYDTFGSSFNTIKTLGFFAREDCKLEYTRWHRTWSISAIEHALTSLDTDVAEALYRVYWLEFIYDARNKKWYEFVGSVWVENVDGIHLKKMISRDFLYKCEEIREAFSIESKNITDLKEKTETDTTHKKLNILIANLKKSTFKRKIMEEAKEMFENEHFSEFLNKNPNITGIKNGVLEIVGNEIIVRPGKPEDYVTMCMNVPYSSHYHWQTPTVEKCMQWLKQVFPDPTLLHYFLKFSASFLKGRNSDKIFAVFTGCSNNSKSMIIKLFEATFGKYVIKMNVSVLSEKAANSGNASPQFARAEATRGCFLDEADDTVQLNKAAIKRMTGGDRFYCRKLNDNGGDIELTYKTIMSTNEIPTIPAEKAIKNRVRIIPFLSQWVEQLPLDEKGNVLPRFFKMDVDFEQQIPMLAPAFLWILTQYYPKYAEERLVTPEIIIKHTEDYWKENDYLGLFISETIQEVYTDDAKLNRDPKAVLTLNRINEAFKEWYKKCYPNRTIPDRDVIRNELNRRWGKSPKGWQGMAIIEENTRSIYDAN